MLPRKTYQCHDKYPHDTRLGEDEQREGVSFFPSTGRGSCQHGSTLDADLGLAKVMLLKCLPDCHGHTTPYISLLSCGGAQRLWCSWQGWHFTSWERTVVHKLFGVLLYWIRVYSPTFIYSIIYLCQYGAQILFHAPSYNPIVYYLFCCSNCSNFIWNLFFFFSWNHFFCKKINVLIRAGIGQGKWELWNLTGCKKKCHATPTRWNK